MTQGFLALILHAHLPYVRHPELGYSLEEKWLYEAITETYVPLCRMLESLVRDGIDFRITISLSPPLLAMLSDDLLQERYLQQLNTLRELAAREVTRTRKDPHFHHLAKMYQNLIEDTYHFFYLESGSYLVNSFRHLQDTGKVEFITVAGTHGYLPFIGLQRQTVRSQIALGVQTHEKALGQQPAGIWLPECAYSPGDDNILAEFGVKYFFVDTHGILYATPRPRYATYAPIICPESGVAVFGRDAESSEQVWSATEGYPGDFDYREFYRDIGYDLDYDYIKPYIHPDGIRTDTGIKYFRITGKTNHKLPYEPGWASQKAAIHAGNFLFNRVKQVEYLSSIMERPPIIVCPYDAELFGHWWFEGPQFLDFLFRKLDSEQKTVKPITPSEYLKMFPINQPSQPCQSSWGNKGYHHVWLEGSNDWIYRHLHHAADLMIELTQRFPHAEGWQKRALNQAGRELLLAQSSDWAFIMKTGTMVDYARLRTNNHVGRFLRLYENLLTDSPDQEWLNEVESRDNIFPGLDYSVFM